MNDDKAARDDAQYTANEYSTSTDPLDKAAYARAYCDDGVRG